MKYILFFLIATFLVVSCAKNKHVDNKILIEINANNEIRIEGKLVLIEDLEKVLRSHIEELEKYDISREDIITRLIIDENAKIGVVSDLQQTMRELNLLKVEYTPKSGKKTINA